MLQCEQLFFNRKERNEIFCGFNKSSRLGGKKSYDVARGKMHTMKTSIISIILMLMVGCSSDPYEILPVIQLTEDVNKQFVFTNKVSGYYTGNSHVESESVNQGWNVDNIAYLQDYRIYSNSKQFFRDSLQQFEYSPISFVRTYHNKLEETFILLDSVDAVIWEFQSKDHIENFSFLPLFHDNISKDFSALTSSSPSLILSPPEQTDSNSDPARKWLGFQYLSKGSNRIVVISAVESSKDLLNDLLRNLSLNYEEKIEDRTKRFTSLLEQNNTYTNVPEINSALAWAQLSLDALIMSKLVKGIWSGLPSGSKYLGRDTFISFAGAYLVKGSYSEARKILDWFSRSQLHDENDRWEGRIPNFQTDDEVAFNTSDVTWLFIRATYEYLLYSGDTTYAKQIYPVIKKAIKGAIRHRIDKYFFLLHTDDESWMDATGLKGALSPRGNRAIEIQALWYTSLQIGSILARMNNDEQLAEHWLAISHTLKSNFLRQFWSSVKNQAFDHLNPDNSRDKKVRPNQILAVYFPGLTGIDPLFSQDQCARITSSVLTRLTYRYGVSSLTQNDEDFHPWFNFPIQYLNEESYYNGAVSTWLAGPVISSMMRFNRFELAFNLFYDNAMQILLDDAIGSLAELRDAIPRMGKFESQVCGKLSHANSLAQFIINFYQDLVGYRPDAIKRTIHLSSKLPADFSYISTKLPYLNTFFIFKFHIEEDIYFFDFEMEDSDNIEEIDVFFDFPGFETQKFRLGGDKSSYVISLDPLNQKSYHQYQDLDWYFAQPEYREDLNLTTE